MRRILFGLLTTLVLAIGFVSCSSDDDSEGTANDAKTKSYLLSSKSRGDFKMNYTYNEKGKMLSATYSIKNENSKKYLLEWSSSSPNAVYVGFHSNQTESRNEMNPFYDLQGRLVQINDFEWSYSNETCKWNLSYENGYLKTATLDNSKGVRIATYEYKWENGSLSSRIYTLNDGITYFKETIKCNYDDYYPNNGISVSDVFSFYRGGTIPFEWCFYADLLGKASTQLPSSFSIVGIGNDSFSYTDNLHYTYDSKKRVIQIDMEGGYEPIKYEYNE